MAYMLSLRKEHIKLSMEATNKEGALRELAEMAASTDNNISAQTLCRIMLDREIIGSTGVGNGIAIPHGKTDQLEEIILCFGRSLRGINFDAIDNRPVHLFLMLLSPKTVAAEYLKTLAQASKILKDEDNREKLLNAATSLQVLEIFDTH